MKIRLIFYLINPIIVFLSGCISDDNVESHKFEFIEGYAYLSGYDTHYGIQVINVENGDTTKTYSNGNFQLPIPETGGEFTIKATYPFFFSDSQKIQVESWGIKSELKDLVLEQKFEITVTTDDSVYSPMDTLYVTATVENVSDSTILGPNGLARWDISLFYQEISVWYAYAGPNPPFIFTRTYEPGEIDSFTTLFDFSGTGLPVAGKYWVYVVYGSFPPTYSVAIKPAIIRIIE